MPQHRSRISGCGTDVQNHIVKSDSRLLNHSRKHKRGQQVALPAEVEMLIQIGTGAGLIGNETLARHLLERGKYRPVGDAVRKQLPVDHVPAHRCKIGHGFHPLSPLIRDRWLCAFPQPDCRRCRCGGAAMPIECGAPEAGWQSGYAEDCKSL